MTDLSEYTRCDTCPLKGKRQIPGRSAQQGVKVEQARVVFVGEGPGYQETTTGSCFVGPSGQLLQRVLDAYGTKGVWLTNAARCQGRREEDKTAAAIACYPRLFHELQSLKPSLIVTLGNVPTNVLLGAGQGITKRRGRAVYSKDLECWVLPTLHPAGVLRHPEGFADLSNDIEKAISTDYANRKPGPVPEDFKYSIIGWHNAEMQAAEPERLGKHLAILGKDALKSRFVVVDLETSGYDAITDRVLCLVVATDNYVLIVPGYTCYLEEFKEFFGDLLHQVKVVGHNAKFDRKFLTMQLGITVDFTWDTLLGHYAIDERRGGHDLKVLAARLFDAPDWEGDIKRYLRKPGTDSYAALPLNVLYRYAAFDGYYTRKLAVWEINELSKAPKQAALVRDLLMPAANALADIELRGIKIDQNKLVIAAQQLSADLMRIGGDKANDWDGEMQALVKVRFNPRSTKQIGVILFDQLGLRQYKGRSTAFDVLSRLKGKHPIIGLLLEYRKKSKLYATYVKGLIKRLGPDGRIRTNFLLFGTVTGRLASRNPNLQNIPSEAESAKLIRGLFVPTDGMTLVHIDFSQMELRMAAMYSKDPYLIDIYERGADLHDQTTMDIFGREDFTPRERFFAKSINFGLLYGRQAHAIANDVHFPGMNMSKTIAYIERFFRRIPYVVKWIREVQDQALHEGYVETPTGRRRRFPLVTSSTTLDVERRAVNFMCQSAASDATLASLIRIHNEMPDAHILLTIHDSIIFECDIDKSMALALQAKDIMEHTVTDMYSDTIPYRADIEIGPSWGELVEVAGAKKVAVGPDEGKWEVDGQLYEGYSSTRMGAKVS